ncbi:PAS domain-containing hybrid sensor histidine kinase/response regulator [Chenggangzhangella methanolivorans]|uniref:histidine kinase n=1 Tax=Chenggangzhangella methanolivorans TaxID=1437009 RepID=A0A9E6RD24_9HYPH|nr:PAS domain S-box protein [Chenggangzhangella methanolivorans]QZN98521.1 PAS domain S-box protein [Chenggangzhangella methanolivorans]
MRCDLDTTRRYVSPAARDVLGYDPAELVGTSPLDDVHPDDRVRLERMFTKLQDGEARTASIRHRARRRNSYVWIEASYRIVCCGAGGKTSFVATVRDVSEGVAAQSALRDSEARFRVLAENASELIILGHDDGRLSYISPASERLLGFTPAELGAMSLADYVHPDDMEQLLAATGRLSRGAAEVSVVYRALHKTRGWISVEGGFRRIPSATGDEPTIVATYRDVSGRMRQDEALRHAKDAAETARAQAEAASRAKSDFLASMSHEIRTPLNGILGYTDLLLEEDGLDAGHIRLVERIQSAGAALLTVVNDILDFSEIESGKVELDPRFMLETLVDNTVSIVRGQATHKRLALEVEVDPAAPRALIGDQDRLRQVLLNLLNNAVKFTPSGSVTLSVEQIGVSSRGARLRFAVTDTGIGIPHEKRARLFERFSQVDGTIRREFGGSGLGLAISKTLVELMGGDIGVDSTPGKGSRFWLEVALPVAGEAEPAAAGRATLSKSENPAHILLVEDLELNQELAVAVLKKAGHTVDVVSDGAQAVHAVQHGRYDLVLMDVHMPGMDGLTATGLIRALDGPVRAIPIVAMTANVLPEQIVRFRAAGMDDHIGKPFKQAELCAAVERWAGAIVEEDAEPSDAGPSAPDPLDWTQFGELTSLLGDASARGLLAKLEVEIGTRLGDASLARGRGDASSPAPAHDDLAKDGLAGDAHAIVSAAGLIGFGDLSRACSELERACRNADPTENAVDAVRTERDPRLRAAA